MKKQHLEALKDEVVTTLLLVEDDQDAIAVLNAVRSSVCGSLGDFDEACEAHDMVMQCDPKYDTWAQPFSMYHRGALCVLQLMLSTESEFQQNALGSLTEAKDYIGKAAQFSGYSFEFRYEVLT
jgi:hypothetical protein